MHDVLYTLIEEADRYQALANMADEVLCQPAVFSKDEELVAFLQQVVRESSHCAKEAERWLAQRVAK